MKKEAIEIELDERSPEEAVVYLKASFLSFIFLLIY